MFFLNQTYFIHKDQPSKQLNLSILIRFLCVKNLSFSNFVNVCIKIKELQMLYRPQFQF